MHDEYLDLVNENDNLIGRELRSIIYKNKWNNFRVVNVFLVNSKGELWIPRRTAQKKVFPLCLDASMGGHVESGEIYEDALGRELKEELNIELESQALKFLGKLNPNKDGISAFMKVYEIKTEITPDYNKDDFIEYFWLKPEDVLDKINRGEKAKGDLAKLIKIFYQ